MPLRTGLTQLVGAYYCSLHMVSNSVACSYTIRHCCMVYTTATHHVLRNSVYIAYATASHSNVKRAIVQSRLKPGSVKLCLITCCGTVCVLRTLPTASPTSQTVSNNIELRWLATTIRRVTLTRCKTMSYTLPVCIIQRVSTPPINYSVWKNNLAS